MKIQFNVNVGDYENMIKIISYIKNLDIELPYYPTLFFNIQEEEGYTFLISASLYERLDLVRYLIEIGVDINIMNNNGKTALDIAIECGHTEIVNYLESNGGERGYNIIYNKNKDVK